MGMWYDTGTIALTNGSAVVTGAGTAFVANVRPGDALVGPNNGIYEVEAIISNTEMQLAEPYLGGTVASTAYKIFPTEGWDLYMVERLDALLNSVDDMIDGPGQGRFPFGSAAEPGIRFAGDEDTGVRRVGSNELALVAGGVDQLVVKGGVASGAAVQSAPLDDGANKLQKFGSFGLGKAITLGPSDNLDAILKSGFYYNSTVNNVPGNNYPAESAGALLVNARTPTNVVQEYTNYASGSLKSGLSKFFRSYGTEGWSPWTAIYHQGNIVAPVADTGGAPSGGAMNEGSNANGKWARLASGLQLCWNDNAAIVTAPAAFVGTVTKSTDNKIWIGRWK